MTNRRGRVTTTRSSLNSGRPLPTRRKHHIFETELPCSKFDLAPRRLGVLCLSLGRRVVTSRIFGGPTLF